MWLQCRSSYSRTWGFPHRPPPGMDGLARFIPSFSTHRFGLLTCSNNFLQRCTYFEEAGASCGSFSPKRFLAMFPQMIARSRCGQSRHRDNFSGWPAMAHQRSEPHFHHHAYQAHQVPHCRIDSQTINHRLSLTEIFRLVICKLLVINGEYVQFLWQAPKSGWQNILVRGLLLDGS